MIKSAEEFKKLRESDNQAEYYRASHEKATIDTWNQVIKKYPELTIWVIHNKTVPLEILEVLSIHDDPKIRSAVATKRKISRRIFDALKSDENEDVRYALICNTTLTPDQKLKIKTEDSVWLDKELKATIANSTQKRMPG